MQQDAKIVIRGTSASVQLADIESLSRAFEAEGLKMSNRNKRINARTSSRGIKWEVGGEELANFGIVSFYGANLKNTFQAKRESTRQSRAEAGIDNAKFAFNMYINSKLFDANWVNSLLT